MAEYATVADFLNDKLILVMASALFGIIATIIAVVSQFGFGYYTNDENDSAHWHQPHIPEGR